MRREKKKRTLLYLFRFPAAFARRSPSVRKRARRPTLARVRPRSSTSSSARANPEGTWCANRGAEQEGRREREGARSHQDGELNQESGLGSQAERAAPLPLMVPILERIGTLFGRPGKEPTSDSDVPPPPGPRPRHLPFVSAFVLRSLPGSSARGTICAAFPHLLEVPMTRSRRSAWRAVALCAVFATLLALAFGRPALRAQPAAEPIKFAHVPHIANDGRIAFTYHDDIWIADPDGSNARRLTAHVAQRLRPALLARRQVDRVHQQPQREQRCVRDPVGRRRAAPAHLLLRRRPGAVLDARRQGDHHLEQPRTRAPSARRSTACRSTARRAEPMAWPPPASA